MTHLSAARKQQTAAGQQALRSGRRHLVEPQHAAGQGRPRRLRQTRRRPRGTPGRARTPTLPAGPLPCAGHRRADTSRATPDRAPRPRPGRCPRRRGRPRARPRRDSSPPARPTVVVPAAPATNATCSRPLTHPPTYTPLPATTNGAANSASPVQVTPVAHSSARHSTVRSSRRRDASVCGGHANTAPQPGRRSSGRRRLPGRRPCFVLILVSTLERAAHVRGAPPCRGQRRIGRLASGPPTRATPTRPTHRRPASRAPPRPPPGRTSPRGRRSAGRRASRTRSPDAGGRSRADLREHGPRGTRRAGLRREPHEHRRHQRPVGR